MRVFFEHGVRRPIASQDLGRTGGTGLGFEGFK
jgi:hypothetical protein